MQHEGLRLTAHATMSEHTERVQELEAKLADAKRNEGMRYGV